MLNPLRNILSAAFFMLSLGCASTPTIQTETSADLPLQDILSAPASLDVRSPDFEAGAALDPRFAFNAFGCTGGNAVPTVEWSGAPAGTQGYAVIVHDPDAPTGVGFFHWVVTGLPSTTTSVGGSAPLPEAATEHHTDYGFEGWGGPCPPPGPAHRYVFSVYALDTAELGLEPGATGAQARFVLASHTLAYGRLVGTFSRGENHNI